MTTIAKHTIISGRVQGVYYRDWTVATASRLGLTGWVRNRHDGTVEAVFCGPAESVEAMLAECREGPPAAKVERVVAQEWQAPLSTALTTAFEKRPTV